MSPRLLSGIAAPILASALAASASWASAPDTIPAWRKLTTEPYRGKQDDVVFLDEHRGWYGNGAGKLFGTSDGGASWSLLWERPGTFIRCLAFVDERIGLLGNVGPGYFPGVTDSVPLYRTDDGGRSWQPVTIEGPPVAGLCAIQVMREPFVNHGRLDTLVRIVAVGRVGGPAAFLWSDDLGRTWRQHDLAAHGAAAFDVHFFDRHHGVVASASSSDVTQSRARILTTSDGGRTWRRAYESDRPYELTWKISFPSRRTGFVTVQSYDPDTTRRARVVARTDDGGLSWREMALVEDHRVRPFGIAFLDERTGWVGAAPWGFVTRDGGTTWDRVRMGNAVNKIRLVRRADGGTTAFALGVELHRLDLPAGPSPPRAPAKR